MCLLGDIGSTTSFWEGNFVSEDIGECRIPVLALEWCSAEEHFVYQDTECPPVNRTRVSTALDHFWCNVLFSSDKGVGTEVSDTALRVDCRHVAGVRIAGDTATGVSTAGQDHTRHTTWVRLLGKIEIRQHDVARLVQ